MKLNADKWVVGRDYTAAPDLRDLPHVGHDGPPGSRTTSGPGSPGRSAP